MKNFLLHSEYTGHLENQYTIQTRRKIETVSQFKGVHIRQEDDLSEDDFEKMSKTYSFNFISFFNDILILK